MQLDYHTHGNMLTLNLEGDFVAYDDDKQMSDLFAQFSASKIDKVYVDGQSLGKWDSTLVVILFELQKLAIKNKFTIEMQNVPQGLRQLLNLAFSVDRKPMIDEKKSEGLLGDVGNWAIGVYNGFFKGFDFLLASLKSWGNLFSSGTVMRRVDLLFALENAGYKALPIVSLISFMVGLILAFVGAVQLKTFGAQIYVASLVTIGMTRIMGAIMTGIIMAGRTGASYAATIGTMQVNEEVDALKTMGIAPMDFLVLPRMIALVITMPILTMWADFMGMLGGGVVGVYMLGIPLNKYWELSVDAVALNNFLVGIFHGWVFGFIIAVCGCYYGVYCGRNADSVGVATTKAVVSAIIWMIVMTGVITVACEVFGI